MAWPLDPPLWTGYVETGALPIQRTPMEQGPDRVTRISSQTTYTIRCSVYVPNSLLAAWQTWLDDEAQMGAAWVQVPIKTDGAVTNHSVRLLSYSASLRTPGKIISVAFETLQRVV